VKAAGFRTRHNNDDVIYKILTVVFDRDDREVMEGLNIQEYVEKLMAEDPWDEVPDDFVLVGCYLHDTLYLPLCHIDCHLLSSSSSSSPSRY